MNKLFYGFIQANIKREDRNEVETRAVVLVEETNFNATMRAYHIAQEAFPSEKGFTNQTARTYKVPDNYLDAVKDND